MASYVERVAIFFAIFNFFSFWESIKKTQSSKNVFFWIENMRTSKNLQNPKIAKYIISFVINPRDLSLNTSTK